MIRRPPRSTRTDNSFPTRRSSDLKIAWEEVAWFYYTNGLPGERTALAGVQQIIPGVATTLSSRAPRSRLLWSPWQHVGADDLGAEALRAATFRCVRAWQASYGSVVVGVSGGLDSSILASSLDRRIDVSGLTISTGDPLRSEEHTSELQSLMPN